MWVNDFKAFQPQKIFSIIGDEGKLVNDGGSGNYGIGELEFSVVPAYLNGFFGNLPIQREYGCQTYEIFYEGHFIG